MLAYSEPNFEDVFMQTFRISYKDVFGTLIHHDLKENGDFISVTQENKYVRQFSNLCLALNSSFVSGICGLVRRLSVKQIGREAIPCLLQRLPNGNRRVAVGATLPSRRNRITSLRQQGTHSHLIVLARDFKTPVSFLEFWLWWAGGCHRVRRRLHLRVDNHQVLLVGGALIFTGRQAQAATIRDGLRSCASRRSEQVKTGDREKRTGFGPAAHRPHVL